MNVGISRNFFFRHIKNKHEFPMVPMITSAKQRVEKTIFAIDAFFIIFEANFSFCLLGFLRLLYLSKNIAMGPYEMR